MRWFLALAALELTVLYIAGYTPTQREVVGIPVDPERPLLQQIGLAPEPPAAPHTCQPVAIDPASLPGIGVCAPAPNGTAAAAEVPHGPPTLGQMARGSIGSGPVTSVGDLVPGLAF